MLLGRFLCEHWITHRAEHDIYAFFVGISIISSVVGIMDMLERGYRFVKRIHRMRWQRTTRLLLRYASLVSYLFTIIILYIVLTLIYRLDDTDYYIDCGIWHYYPISYGYCG